MKVRFAPSPTGALHIGGARTALYNWLAARGGGGTMLLRIEDTDRERSTPENVEQILEALEWLGLDWDEGPLSQFEARASHASAVERLLEADLAYRDPAGGEQVREWKRQHGADRGYRGTASEEPGAAVRLRVPDQGETVVEDLIRGRVGFPNASQDDFVIARGDGTPLYNLAVAVDDAEMGITEVIRGDDHLSNTPKQLLVLRALGAAEPRYAHLPLLHGPDGKKLSKRHGAASVQELRDAGYLPEAVRNYLALLGWGTDDDTTVLSTAELTERFRIGDVGRSAAIFDERKLRWLNGRYMRELPLEEYVEAARAQLRRDGHEAALADPAQLRAGCEIAQEKAQTMAELWPLIRYLFEPPVDDPKAREKFLGPDSQAVLGEALALLRDAEPFDAANLELLFGGLIERTASKPKNVYQPLRVALTGTTVSPGIFETVSALGREDSVARVEQALARIG